MTIIYEPTVWENEVPNGSPTRYAITKSDGTVLDPGATIEIINLVTPGTPLDATHLNKMEQGIKSAQESANNADSDAATAQSAANQAILNAAAAASAASAAIPKSVIAAVGDLITGTGTATPSRVPAGSEGQILAMKGGVPAWSPALGALLRQGVITSSGNNVITSVSSFSETTFNNGGYAGSGRITVPSGLDGLYLVMAQGYWDTNAAGNRQLGVRVSGTSTYIWNTVPALTGSNTWQQYFTIRSLKAGDYIELETLQTSGGSLNFNSGELGLFLLR
jgi:hypothetical protein